MIAIYHECHIDLVRGLTLPNFAFFGGGGNNSQAPVGEAGLNKLVGN